MERFSDWVDRSSLYIALLAAWVAMCGSLYFSEVAGYIPCMFCWYQRILMYPLAVIIAVGIWRQDRHLPFYVLPLSIGGIGVSTYHYLLQKTSLFSELSTCQVGVPCSGIWINWLGFITIPFLALIAFFIITMMTVIALQAGLPGADEDDDDLIEEPSAQPRALSRPWLPAVVIIAIVVIVFLILGQLGSSTADTHATTEFSIVEGGAQTLMDGTMVDEESIAEGRRLYGETCAACHGANGEGVAGIGSSLIDSPLVAQSTDEELLLQIRTGLNAGDQHNESGITMPASGGRPDLTDDELRLIIQYLRAGA